MIMAYFKYNGKKIYYEEHGTGEPLILLHGNTASSKMFNSVIDYYSDTYKVITLDFLGHGKSERIDKFPVNLWLEEAKQTITLINFSSLKKVNLLGTSGGAYVAINVALERPDLINKVIADSFNGRTLGKVFIERLVEERATCKNNEDAKQFYFDCHGYDWEKIVNQDTESFITMAKKTKDLFSKNLYELKTPLMLTASYRDDMIRKDFEHEYSSIIKEVSDGKMHFFQEGYHPAIISNSVDFSKVVKSFL